jgi:hypothetical protein
LLITVIQRCHNGRNEYASYKDDWLVYVLYVKAISTGDYVHENREQKHDRQEAHQNAENVKTAGKNVPAVQPIGFQPSSQKQEKDYKIIRAYRR